MHDINAQQRRIIDDTMKMWTAQGRLIEGGWQAFLATSGLMTASEQQRREMRKAYFLGAQHLFACFFGIMDSDREPTLQDLAYVEQIDKELKEFIKSLNLGV